MRCYVEPEGARTGESRKDALVKKGEELIAEHADLAGLRAAYALWYRENKQFLWPLDRYKYIDNGGVYTGSQSVHNPGKEGYRYDVPHPVTGKPCKEPLMGYRFPPETMEELLAKERLLFGRDENKIIELKVYAHEFQDKLSSLFELDGRLGPYDLKALFPGTAQGLHQSEAGRLALPHHPIRSRRWGYCARLLRRLWNYGPRHY